MKMKIIRDEAGQAEQAADLLKRWEKRSGLVAMLCSEVVCSRKAAGGVLVAKLNSTDGLRYIVPLCLTHLSLQAEEVDLMPEALMVLADSGGDKSLVAVGDGVSRVGESPAKK